MDNHSRQSEFISESVINPYISQQLRGSRDVEPADLSGV